MAEAQLLERWARSPCEVAGEKLAAGWHPSPMATRR